MMQKLMALATVLAMVMFAISGCAQKSSPSANESIATTQPSKTDWQTFRTLHIFFGHQSVGGNIIEGIETLAKEQGIPITVMESRSQDITSGLQHFKVGENGNPNLKIADFESTLSDQLAKNTDIALMKFCFIDFNSQTNTKNLADTYLSALHELQSKYPNVRFIAATAPLTTIESGPKAWIKRLIGRDPDGYKENMARQRFNEIVRSRVSATFPLFDIAGIESRSGHQFFEFQSQHIEMLDPALSSDGGHLNDAGQKLLAAEFVKLTAQQEPSHP